MTQRQIAVELMRKHIKKYDSNIYMIKPDHFNAVIDSIVEALNMHESENKCSCGSEYYHNYKCINTHCNNCIIYKE